MTSETATHVRIFLAGEFAPPPNWPEDVGIAVVRTSARQSEVFPVHRHESGASVLRRIEDLSGIALGAAAVHPPVDGHPECDLSFSTVRDLLTGIEEFLAASPEAVEEAEDFAVNFAFAAEEGIDMSGAFAPPVREAASPREARPAPPTLPGYAPAIPGAGRRRPFASAVLRIDASGGALIVLDPLAPPDEISTPEILLRDDGLGFAVHRRAAEGRERRPYALRLPPGSLPGALEGFACDIPLVSTERGDHLLFTPLPGFASRPAAQYPSPVAPATAVPAAERGTARARNGRAGWRRAGGLGAVTGVVLLVGAVLLSSAPTRALQPESPVETLRSGLFRASP